MLKWPQRVSAAIGVGTFGVIAIRRSAAVSAIARRASVGNSTRDFFVAGGGHRIVGIRRRGDVFNPGKSAETQVTGHSRSAIAEFGMARARE